MKTRSGKRLQKVSVRVQDSGVEAGPTTVEAQSPAMATTTNTVGIHAVTLLTQQSDERSSGLPEGPSEGNPARQGRMGSWKSHEISELKRLAAACSGPKGISWVKVLDAWNSLELPPRTKASLSSKWNDIRTRSTVLDPTKSPASAVLSGTPKVSKPQDQTIADNITTQEVNIAGKPKRKKSPVAITSDPAPIQNSLDLGKIGDYSLVDAAASTFKRNLRKARRIGCQVYRKPPKRVTLGNNTKLILQTVDHLMMEEVDQKMKGAPTWNQLSVLVYAGALTVDELANQSSDEKRNRTRAWFTSSYVEIDRLRQIIGKATAELQRRKKNADKTPTDQQLRNIRLLKRTYKCETFVEITTLVEKLKGRLQLLLARIELRKADEQRYQVRHQPAKMIFRDKESKDNPEKVDTNKVRRYWKTIVGVKKEFDHQNPLLVAWKQTLPEYPEVSDLSESLNLEIWQKVVSKLKPWKATGPDGLQSFWWKTFKTAHMSLYKLVHHHLTSGARLPQKWITEGRIVLLFKSGSRSDPANFRPIACLNTCYKLLTGFVTAYLNEYVMERQILAREQRALHKGVWGCTHALILDQTLIADAKNQKQRRISVAWIDYAKAFDSVPHAYIEWLFRVMQVPKPLRKFLNGLMKSWRVKYEAKSPGGKVERSSYLRIRSGVLQGDSFSPLLFCLAMVPISHALNSTNRGYQTASGKRTGTRFKLSHQFYMDDLKLYAGSEQGLAVLLRTVESISSAISMKVNLKKCAVAHFVPKRLSRIRGTKAGPPKASDFQKLEGGQTSK